MALVAAAPPPKATPKPVPTPSHAAAPAATANPIPMIVVFPFQTSSDLKADTGQRAAQLFVDQINQAGGLDAILSSSNTARSQYLDYARKLQADFYLTGYMTPLGNGVSLVEQVVSTQSGTIVYGSTAQIDSFEDASSQAIQIHGAILSMEQDAAGRYSSEQGTTTSTPAPAATNQANIGKGFSDIAGLFKHHAAATAKPVAIQKPAKGIYLVRVTGSVPQNNLNSATSVLYNSLNQHFNVQMTSASSANVAKEADGICGSRRDNTVVTGTLSAATSKHGLGSRTQWTFSLDVYTCFGAKLAQSGGEGDSLEAAVKAAADAYATSHPQNG